MAISCLRVLTDVYQTGLICEMNTNIDLQPATSSYVNQTSGAPTGMGSPFLAAPFWQKVDVRGEDDCWPYTGYCDRDGYGEIRRWEDGHYRSFRATHLALGVRLPGGLEALHTCDNPPCCNPRHLAVGTHADNMTDCAVKGRHHAALQTHCKRGHEFTAENTYIKRSGSRKCRACERKGVRVAVVR